MPQGSESSSSAGLEAKKHTGCHARDASNLEMFMNAAESDRKQKLKDEFELEFEVNDRTV